MLVRLQLTAVPVEVGLVPSVTVALRVVLLPASTGDGLAEPVALGLVEPAQTLAADDEFRGAAAATVKSVELLLESVQPALARNAAVVLDRTAVGEASEQFAAP